MMEDRGISQAQLSRGTGIPPRTIGDWKKLGTNPGSDKIACICDFLGISTDYLLTGKEKSSSPLRDDELELLQYYNALPVRDQGKILGQLAELTKGAAIPREGTA
ncbi:helix-turn-helix domain-containing protein [Anaerotruncus sp. AF02-27]|uniref:helix-turn-helix domain-containing protein n=2 Tax=Anaerotruncus TaxID=244127 RepID=UPI0035140A9A